MIMSQYRYMDLEAWRGEVTPPPQLAEALEALEKASKAREEAEALCERLRFRAELAADLPGTARALRACAKRLTTYASRKYARAVARVQKARA